MKIGLIPGSFKPFHRGHDDLVRLAAEENDLVYVYYSLSSRGDISGKSMKIIMDMFVKPSYANSNVTFLNVSVPVTAIYNELQSAEKDKSKDIYTIYSDTDDIEKYKLSTLQKIAPNLLANEQIIKRGVERGIETTSVSGTKMREYLIANDVENFAEMLPVSIQQHADDIIGILRNKLQESLVRNLIRKVLKECGRKA